MIRPFVTVSAKDEKEALVRGSGLLNVKPGELNALQVDEESYRVSLKNMPGWVDITISRDKMSVYMTVHPTSGTGEMVTMDMAGKLLDDRGIVHGVDWPAVEEALTRASSEAAPIQKVLVARGDPPEKGIDARIELKVTPDKIAGTVIDKTGRMDYRERGCIKNVKKGELLAIKIPFTEGRDGMDVFGNVIKALAGTDTVLVPTENVVISEDGLQYTAGVDGMVTLMDENNIGVCQMYQVPGDVDYSTGNLEMDGSLQITGWIRTGFDVRASCDIHVEGGIEGANVEAGGNILVKGGIIGSGEGRVVTGGGLTALYIENASVHANEDILVNDNVIRSRVTSNRNVCVKGGKGRIMGGEVEAFKVIEADEIGTATGIRTRVSVGTDSTIRQCMDDATRRLEDFRRNKAKMDMVLARYAKRGKGNKLPRETARKLARVVKLRRDAIRAGGRLVKYREDLAMKMSDANLGAVAIRVKKVVYSGTTIMVGGYAYEVRDNIRGQVKFILNTNEKVVEPIRRPETEEEAIDESKGVESKGYNEDGNSGGHQGYNAHGGRCDDARQ